MRRRIMSTVIPFKEASRVIDVVKELEQAVYDDMVTEAVLVYRTKAGQIHRYWFGEDSTLWSPVGPLVGGA